MIPRELYSQIHSLMPILCVDLAVVADGKVLLVRRKVEPLKGELYLPGGRLFRWETVDEAVFRIARNEIGLKIFSPVFVSYEQMRFGRDPFNHGKGTHTVSLTFACEAYSHLVKLDSDHSSYVWFDPSEIEPGNFFHNLPRLANSAMEAVMKKERVEL